MGTSRSLTSLLILAFLLGACSEKAAVSYDSVGELVEAMAAEDVVCSPLETGSGEAELVREQGSCEVGGERLEIFLFDNAKDRDNWLALGGRLRPATAFGPNWSIIGEEKVVQSAADALGANLRE